MTEAASSPIPPSVRRTRVLQPEVEPPRPCPFLEARLFSEKSGSEKSGAPPPAARRQDRPPLDPILAAHLTAEARRPVLDHSSPRHLLIEGLRRRIREIERHALLSPEKAGAVTAPWLLGAPEADARLGRAGLDTAGVHEMKPMTEGSAAGSKAAALAFALRLAARRLQRMASGSCGLPRLLWCAPAAAAHETGLVYGPGLAALGLNPRSILIVETARETDALWAIEEGLNSGGLALVIGLLLTVALSPARRLSLAAERHGTPCLLITEARTPPAAATATRWRIGPAPSPGHPLDPRAPGSTRCQVSLERCRSAPPGPETSFLLEWSDETPGFRMAADVADRAVATPYALRRAG